MEVHMIMLHNLINTIGTCNVLSTHVMEVHMIMLHNLINTIGTCNVLSTHVWRALISLHSYDHRSDACTNNYLQTAS